MRDNLGKWGVLSERMHVEISGALEAITPGVGPVDHAPHPPEGPAGPGSLVSFARSGITMPWNPQFESLLGLAEACDVSVRWSSRNGGFHTCVSGLVSGSISYRPEPLDRPSRENVLICCSQPSANVILDL
jgi:hypothetical protein